MEDLITEMGIVFLVFVAIGVVTLNVIYVHNKMDNVPVTVKYQNKIVFTGPSCAVHVGSTGDTTTVQINNGFLYLIPQKIYSGKGIEIVGEK